MYNGKVTLVVGLTAALVAAQALAGTPRAFAQCDTSTDLCSTVSPDGKGIAGGLIIGAEIGFMANALIVNAGVREFDEAWAWIIFPAVLGGLGALGGYYGLEQPAQGMTPAFGPEPAVSVLAVGMALIVPTFVGVLALTAYNPGADTGGTGASGDDDYGDDSGGAEESNPPAEAAPEATPEADSESALRRTLAGGPGLLRFDRGQILLGVPMVHTASRYTLEERTHMRLGQATDLRVPLVSGVW